MIWAGRCPENLPGCNEGKIAIDHCCRTRRPLWRCGDRWHQLALCPASPWALDKQVDGKNRDPQDTKQVIRIITDGLFRELGGRKQSASDDAVASYCVRHNCRGARLWTDEFWLPRRRHRARNTIRRPSPRPIRGERSSLSGLFLRFRSLRPYHLLPIICRDGQRTLFRPGFRVFNPAVLDRQLVTPFIPSRERSSGPATARFPDLILPDNNAVRVRSPSTGGRPPWAARALDQSACCRDCILYRSSDLENLK